MPRICWPKVTGVFFFLLTLAAPALAQIDFSGEWFTIPYEDPIDRRGGPEIGDYTGLPINDANRFRADRTIPRRLPFPNGNAVPTVSTGLRSASPMCGSTRLSIR